MKTDLKNINELNPFFNHEELRFSTEEKRNSFLKTVPLNEYEIKITKFPHSNHIFTHYIYVSLQLNYEY